MPKKMMVPAFPMVSEPLKADCVPCLEDAGLWYYAQKVRMGHDVYDYEVREALDESREKYGGHDPNQTVLPPIRNSAGTNSVGAMMSEGCPPNTGRTYDKA